MQVNKKLVALFVLSIAIGAAIVLPLAFFMFSVDNPQYSIQIPYTYIGNFWDNNTANNIRAQNYGWLYSFVFRASPKFSLNPFSASAVYELYSIEVYSDKGFIGNVTYTVETRTSSFVTDGYQGKFDFTGSQWFNVTQNVSTGIQGFANGTSLAYLNGSADNWNSSIGKPQTLSLTVIREGWVTVNGNNASVHLANSEKVLELQLQPYGDGFIYNNLLSADKLSNTNPIMPQYAK